MQKIRVAGIVAEYNPFHKGHAWMARQLREQGAQAIVCVMSGSYVQRAEPAFFPPHVRAKAALLGGVDLVLRLPLGWATASAERFAEGSVGTLAALGCVDTLAFGAETANTALLDSIARLLTAEEFKAELKRQLAKGVSFAAARQAAVEVLRPGAGRLLATPNNILAIEYCKALHKYAPKLAYRPDDFDIDTATDYTQNDNTTCAGVYPRPFALPRQGAAHDGAPDNGIASASWLRSAVRVGGIDALSDYVPEACMPLYRQAWQQGQWLDPARWELALLSRLRGLDVAAFAKSPFAGEGLEARVAAASSASLAAEELYSIAKTKRFAHSRVRRLALSVALGIPPNLPELPPFIQVMAANENGLALLKKAQNSTALTLSTSLAKLARTDVEAARVVKLESAAEDLYALCMKQPLPGGQSFTQPAVFIKGGSNGTI